MFWLIVCPMDGVLVLVFVQYHLYPFLDAAFDCDRVKFC